MSETIEECVTNVEDVECVAAIAAIIENVTTSLFQRVGDNEGTLIPQVSSDAIWLVLSGALVFFMHAGFSMLEAGSVRRPNVVNIMFKNVGTIVLGAMAYWSLGFGFAYGEENSFIGASGFFFDFNDRDDANEAFFFFQFTFAVTAATIISGAVAERVTLEAYFLVVLFTTSFVFPLVSHWVWSDVGFMSAFNLDDNNTVAGDLLAGSIGLIDFAGSGVVHITGGIMALVGAYIIGPRGGRFVASDDVSFGVASYSLQALGTFILWFGWFGFNAGSSLAFEGTNTAKAALLTVLSPSAAGIVGTIVPRFLYGHYDLSTLLNCVLAGLVSITAGCASVFDFSAIIIGIIGAFIYLGGAHLLVYLKIDDPLVASVVHGFCGAWGLLAVGIFADNDAILDAYGVVPESQAAQFGMQVVGALIIVIWSFSWGGFLFGALKLTGILRVTDKVEEIGLDDSEMGGSLVVFF